MGYVSLPEGIFVVRFCQETFARVCERWLLAVQRASLPWAFGVSARARVNHWGAWWKEARTTSSKYLSTIIIRLLNANLPQHVPETKQTENNNIRSSDNISLNVPSQQNNTKTWKQYSQSMIPPTTNRQSKKNITRWWLNQPIWKILVKNGFIFPNFRGEHSKKYLSCHHPDPIQDAPREMSAWNFSRVEGHTHSNNEGAGGLSIPQFVGFLLRVPGWNSRGGGNWGIRRIPAGKIGEP